MRELSRNATPAASMVGARLLAVIPAIFQDVSERLRSCCGRDHRVVSGPQHNLPAISNADRSNFGVEDDMRRISTIAIIVAIATITTAWSMATIPSGSSSRGFE